MSNGIKWAPIFRYPGYEVSMNHLVRNERTKKLVRQRVDPFDRERRTTVTLVRNGRAKVVFVPEIVATTFEGVSV